MSNYIVNQLRETRKKFSLSRSLISRFLKCPEINIWRWENSISDPSPVYQAKISQLLKVIDELKKDIINEKS